MTRRIPHINRQPRRYVFAKVHHACNHYEPYTLLRPADGNLQPIDEQLKQLSMQPCTQCTKTNSHIDINGNMEEAV